jgi:hypothetical protein
LPLASSGICKLAWQPLQQSRNGTVPGSASCSLRRGLGHNGPEVLAVLRQQFSEQALIAAGILEQTTAGELLLNTGLCHECGAVIALRRTLDGAPFDLLTRTGMLSGSCAALAAVHDAATVRAMRDDHVLFATAAIEDAAILRTFGLATTTVAGLTRLSIRRQRRMAQVFGDEPATPECRPSQAGTGGAAAAQTTSSLIGSQILPTACNWS